MFKPEVLPPGEQTNVQIIYLPRRVGSTDVDLTIKTSLGLITLPITASAIRNPYRLLPISSSRIPAGMVYSWRIVIYNPFEEILYIREVFTTESFLHLSLPDSDGGSSLTSNTEVDGVWQVLPHTEKEIIQLSFSENQKGSFQGYVHIKTDQDNLVLPVELNVLKGGIHVNPHNINFGILTTKEERSTVLLSLLNSGPEPIGLIQVSPLQHDPFLTVEFEVDNILLPGEELKDAIRLTYSGEEAQTVQGKILVATNHSNPALSTTEVAYEATVLHGGVACERRALTFNLGLRFSLDGLLTVKGKGGENVRLSSALLDQLNLTQKWNIAGLWPSAWDYAQRAKYLPDGNVFRRVRFMNQFPTPLELEDVWMKDCSRFIEIADFPMQAIADQENYWENVTIRLKPRLAVKSHPPFTCTICLKTNISIHEIPIYLYDSSLHVTSPEEDWFPQCRTSEFLVPEWHSSRYGIAQDSRLQYLTKYGNCQPQTSDLKMSMKSKALEWLLIQQEKLQRHEASPDGTVIAFKSPIDLDGEMLPINFGRLGLGQVAVRNFNLTNFNPVPVNVTATNPGFRFAQLRYRGQVPSPHAPPEILHMLQDMQDVIDSVLPDLDSVLPAGNFSDFLRDVSSERLNNRAVIGVHEMVRETQYADRGLSREVVKHPIYKEQPNPHWTLLPGHVGLFEVIIRAPDTIIEEMQQVIMRGLELTTVSENIRLQLSFQVVTGELQFSCGKDGVFLGNSYPGFAISAPLTATSKFPQPVFLEDIKISNSTPNRMHAFSAHLNVNSLPTETQDVVIGKISFDPSLVCEDAWECIILSASSHLKRSDSKSQQNQPEVLQQLKSWLKAVPSMQLDDYDIDEIPNTPSTIPVSQVKALQGLEKTLAQLKETNLTVIKSDVEITSSLGNNHHISVQAEMSIPKFQFLHESNFIAEAIDFGLTRVGDVSSKYIGVYNPSTVPIRFKIVLKEGESLIRLLNHNNYTEDILESETDKENFLRGCYEYIDGTCGADGTCGVTMGHIPRPNSNSVFYLLDDSLLSVFVPPGFRSYFGPIFFSPSSVGNFSSSVYLQNNLTRLEEIKIHGVSGLNALTLSGDNLETPVAEMNGNESFCLAETTQRIQNVHAHSLSFPIKREDVEGRSSAPWPTPVLQILSVQNTGDLPVNIEQLAIGGDTCEESGFSIAPCLIGEERNLSLLPGESTNVEIRYRTSCLSLVVERPLHIKTERHFHKVILKAVLPAAELHRCRIARFYSNGHFVWNFTRMLCVFCGFVAITLSIVHFFVQYKVVTCLHFYYENLKTKQVIFDCYNSTVVRSRVNTGSNSESNHADDSLSPKPEQKLSARTDSSRSLPASSSCVLLNFEQMAPSVLLGISCSDAGLRALASDYMPKGVMQLLAKRQLGKAEPKILKVPGSSTLATNSKEKHLIKETSPKKIGKTRSHTHLKEKRNVPKCKTNTTTFDSQFDKGREESVSIDQNQGNPSLSAKQVGSAMPSNLEGRPESVSQKLNHGEDEIDEHNKSKKKNDFSFDLPHFTALDDIEKKIEEGLFSEIHQQENSLDFSATNISINSSNSDQQGHTQGFELPNSELLPFNADESSVGLLSFFDCFPNQGSATDVHRSPDSLWALRPQSISRAVSADNLSASDGCSPIAALRPPANCRAVSEEISTSNIFSPSMASLCPQRIDRAVSDDITTGLFANESSLFSESLFDDYAQKPIDELKGQCPRAPAPIRATSSRLSNYISVKQIEDDSEEIDSIENSMAYFVSPK